MAAPSQVVRARPPGSAFSWMPGWIDNAVREDVLDLEKRK
jgi:hypothetical protein